MVSNQSINQSIIPLADSVNIDERRNVQCALDMIFSCDVCGRLVVVCVSS